VAPVTRHFKGFGITPIGRSGDLGLRIVGLLNSHATGIYAAYAPLPDRRLNGLMDYADYAFHNPKSEICSGPIA
jgi:hypothetical protein